MIALAMAAVLGGIALAPNIALAQHGGHGGGFHGGGFHGGGFHGGGFGRGGYGFYGGFGPGVYAWPYDDDEEVCGWMPERYYRHNRAYTRWAYGCR